MQRRRGPASRNFQVFQGRNLQPIAGFTGLLRVRGYETIRA
jgi:hypothetical protein